MVAIAKFIGKMQKRKSGIMKSGLDAMLLFILHNLFLKGLDSIIWQSTNKYHEELWDVIANQSENFSFFVIPLPSLV